jgi:hypothetical protein
VKIVTFVLVGFHRMAVSTRSGAVTADAGTIGPSEEFDLLECGDGLLAIRTLQGTYLAARADGKLGTEVDSHSAAAKFRLVLARSGRLGLLTNHDCFVSASPEGVLEADRRWLRDWEEFYLHQLPNVDEFAPVSQRIQGSLSAKEVFERCAAEQATAARDALAVVSGLVTPAPGAG